ncbi:unnamed protein product [Coregonus sp. 'balchen']|nr:unnamed protein product [Coregonus sp. 'balchen']
MTSRLLGRCARLLPRASPQASATAARLPTPAAGPAEPLWAQAWWQPVGRGLCEGRSLVKDEYPIEPKRTQLDELLERAQSPQDVLQAWVAQGGKANQAAKTLVQLVRLAGREKGGAKIDQFELLTDPRLLDIMDTVTAQVASVWNGTLVSLLRSLSALGVPPTAAVQRSIQTEVLWRVRRLSYKQLAFLADWGAGRKGQMEVALVSAALKQLELRWTEIADARTALELAEGFGAEDIRRVCVSLASQGRRMPEISSADVTRCAKSLAFLKWLHFPLFEAFAEVHSALEGVLPSLEAFLQTDVVWSLCVLQQAKTQHITALTQHTHIAKLSEGSLSRVENYRLKLLHIIATLQLENPESPSSTLPTEAMLLPSTLGRDSPLSPLQTGLKGALDNLVGGKAEALRTGVNTIYGWTIDGELVVDSENKPMDLVPYYEWLELKSDWQKGAYVKDKMGKAIAEEMAK